MAPTSIIDWSTVPFVGLMMLRIGSVLTILFLCIYDVLLNLVTVLIRL